VNENPSPTPSGNRWEPPAVPAWHPEHVDSEAAAMPSRTATSELPPVSGADTAGGPVAGPGKPRRALPPRLRKRAAVSAAAVALLAVGGVGGFAVGSAAADDDDAGSTSVVRQDGTPTNPDGDGFPGGRPGFGRGTPPGSDDGTTDDGTTDGTTSDGTAGDSA
jgi:hypothetical protein